jgi:hypothetical protein
MSHRFGSILSFLAICFWSNGNFLPFEGSSRTSQGLEKIGPSFRYVILYNDLVDVIHEADPNRSGPKHRFVDVLMDEDAFKEENLRVLYLSVSRRFPEPKLLSVSVVTSLRDTETPEEHEGPHMSEPEGPTPPHRKEKSSPSATEASNYIEHPSAIFIRTDKTEVIRYRYPTSKGAKVGEIVLRGPVPEKERQHTEHKN